MVDTISRDPRCPSRVEGLGGEGAAATLTSRPPSRPLPPRYTLLCVYFATDRTANVGNLHTYPSSLARVWPAPSVRLEAPAAAIPARHAAVLLTSHLAHRARTDILVLCADRTLAAHALPASALRWRVGRDATDPAPAHGRLRGQGLVRHVRESGREHVLLHTSSEDGRVRAHKGDARIPLRQQPGHQWHPSSRLGARRIGAGRRRASRVSWGSRGCIG
jgi:hypothetical protein